jgi:hypothetical protein
MRASSPRTSTGMLHLMLSANVLLNFEVYQITHTPITAKDWNNMASADLRRERPEYKKPIPGMIRKTRNDMIIRYM